MPRDENDATRNLEPEDETQETEAGLEIGKRDREDVLADFRKIASPAPERDAQR
jgi:hypothetical protein